jgi:flagellar hook-basal body complex protein FliE
MSINTLESVGRIGTIDTIDYGDTKLRSNGIDEFKKIFDQAIEETTKLLDNSNQLTDDFAAGKTDNIHQVMIAGEKASVALQFTLQIRNKIMDAYNEIMRMQI